MEPEKTLAELGAEYDKSASDLLAYIRTLKARENTMKNSEARYHLRRKIRCRTQTPRFGFAYTHMG